MVADWAIFANAKTLLSAFMALLGLASGKKSSLVAFMVAGPSPQTSRNRRRLHVEGLEQRQLMAADFPEFVDPRASFSGNQFGHTVVALNGGNVVITSPFDDAGGANAGAVYLFNGKTGALISTLTGSKANDNVGIGGVTALSNGNYVVMSPSWDNGAVVDAGAVTFGSGTTGVIGAISAANSLVGSTNGDMSTAAVTVLKNGENGGYVVRSPLWNNGPVVDAGAVTFGGLTGVSGAISASNSLVGSTTGDMSTAVVTALTKGNYVVRSPLWNNETVVDAGAVTFGGLTGVSGVISASNSLVGTTSGDMSSGSVTALSTGNYVVMSPLWDNGTGGNAGAVTFGGGKIGVKEAISVTNSLVGSAGESVGSNGVTALTNGNYVFGSQSWGGSRGAATFVDVTKSTSTVGVVSSANSLVGTNGFDFVGNRAQALENGNYVIISANWATQRGAVTFGDGTNGTFGVVSGANSLVGSTVNDRVGNGGVKALSNGNYVVMTPEWDNGAARDAGAATFGSSSTNGVKGAISDTNSLVGESLESLDEDGCLDRHVERPGDAGSFERLTCGELVSDGHEARHLGFGDAHFLVAPGC